MVTGCWLLVRWIICSLRFRIHSCRYSLRNVIGGTGCRRCCRRAHRSFLIRGGVDFTRLRRRKVSFIITHISVTCGFPLHSHSDFIYRVSLHRRNIGCIFSRQVCHLPSEGLYGIKQFSYIYLSRKQLTGGLVLSRFFSHFGRVGWLGRVFVGSFLGVAKTAVINLLLFSIVADVLSVIVVITVLTTSAPTTGALASNSILGVGISNTLIRHSRARSVATLVDTLSRGCITPLTLRSIHTTLGGTTLSKGIRTICLGYKVLSTSPTSMRRFHTVLLSFGTGAKGPICTCTSGCSRDSC